MQAFGAHAHLRVSEEILRFCGKVAETGFKVGRSGVAASSVNGDELADWIVPIPSLIIVCMGYWIGRLRNPEAAAISAAHPSPHGRQPLEMLETDHTCHQ